MRTTLDIADDILFAAKEIARREKKSLGQTISDLARQAFAQPASASSYKPRASASTPARASERLAAYGVHPLPSRGDIVSTELIAQLRDQEGV